MRSTNLFLCIELGSIEGMMCSQWHMSRDALGATPRKKKSPGRQSWASPQTGHE